MQYRERVLNAVFLIILIPFLLFARDRLLFQQAAFDLGGEPSVSSIQDSDGFLWFGSTASGLIRYDGYSVKKFRPGPNSVNNGWVNAIFEDSDGIIWIGTNGGGLNRYDKKRNSFTYYTHDPKNEKSISSNVFMMFSPLIIEDLKHPGILWLGTQGGLNRFDTESETFTRFTHDSTKTNTLSHDEVYSIQQDREGILWIGTKNGLNRFDPVKGNFTRYLHNPADSSSLPDPEVWSLLDDDSLLWVGTGKGELLSFDKKREIFTKRHSYGATVLGLDRLSSNRLALTAGAALNGLTIYDKTTGETVNYKPEEGNKQTLSDIGIRSLLEDKLGILWVVTNKGTVDKYDKNAMKFRPYPVDPGNPKTISSSVVMPRIIDRRGYTWIGGTAGLTVYNPETEEFANFVNDPKNPNSLPQNYPSSILEDSDGTIWIGTFTGGLVSWDREKNEVIKKIDLSAIYELQEDQFDKDILWGATYLNGFVKYNKKSGEITQYKNDPKNPQSISSNISVSFLQDKDYPNTLWLAMTGTGISRFNKREGTFENFFHDPNDSTSIVDNMVWKITYDSRGRIWLGTAKGLSRFDPITGKSVNFTEANGYPLSNSHWILEDNHERLWIGADAGLVVFDIRKEQVVKVYTPADGIAGMPFFATAHTKAPDGTFWVGGFKGLNVFHPDSLKDNDFLPPVYLTSLTQGGEEIELTSALEHTKEITLNWQHNYFEFEYAALNYTLPEKNQYQYMLEGWEDQWYHAGTLRKGRYSVLSPGSYTLRVRGSNNDGVWSDREAALKVTVLTPPWKSSVAYGLYSIIILAGIAAYLYSQDRRQKELEKLVQKRTAELNDAKDAAEYANSAKSDFIANMSHEIRTPMNAVLGFTEILREDAVEPHQKRYLDTIYTSGTALLHLINDILDLSKVESGKMELSPVPTSLKTLASEMHTIFYQKIDNKGLEYECRVDESVPPALLVDEIRLRQVLINLIGNAIKFTDSGSVSLSVKAVAEHPGSGRVDLELTVKDSGIGIPRDQHEKIFRAFEQVKGQSLKLYGGTGLGLAISTRLIALMGGKITLESEPGRGAAFTVVIPGVEITAEDALNNLKESFDTKSIEFEPAVILIADDIDYNREIITTFLKEWNISLLQAANGEEAVELALRHKPDLILMDMKMPVMDGYEASRQIHDAPETADIPIIAVTASTLKRDEAALSVISDGFIRKPLDKAGLVKEIMPFLKHTRRELSSQEEQSTEALNYPSKEILDELKTLVDDGYLDQVKERVTLLEKESELYRGFAKEVANYCALFDDDGLLGFLEQE